ncbi:hypothetical protein D1AOALGA4SA_3686 [Olavius algarvensis Delta 1 endosymbiont]|nr:hypothetical protein D1AOALGA4SA_3686 [Olavius algarvensis Delta 1 endosymbiont]
MEVKKAGGRVEGVSVDLSLFSPQRILDSRILGENGLI